MLLLVDGWVVNDALQLETCAYEALFSITAVALFLLVAAFGQRGAALLGLYVALGLTCVFSMPDLFVVTPLLALDLAASIRSRRQLPVHVVGEAVAIGLALGNYAVAPPAAVGMDSNAAYSVADAHRGAWWVQVRLTVQGVASFFLACSNQGNQGHGHDSRLRPPRL